MSKPSHSTADIKTKGKLVRERLKHQPPIEQVVEPDDLTDASPFYFVLRSFVASLKTARQRRGLTLADLATRTGLALETLSRLETGALVNPTWQTLTKYAVAVGCNVQLNAEDTAVDRA